jgi:hypothetical protein
MAASSNERKRAWVEDLDTEGLQEEKRQRRAENKFMLDVTDRSNILEEDARKKGLAYHIDQRLDGKRRVQAYVHFVVGSARGRLGERRSLLFIPGSFDHWSLFSTYYKTHHAADLNSRSAPCFLRALSLSAFNKDLALLKESHPSKSDWLSSYRSAPDSKDLNELPNSFFLRRVEHSDNSLVLFRTKTIHSVTSGFVGKKVNPKPFARCKVTFEVVESTEHSRSIDCGKMQWTDGSYKKRAFKFEQERTPDPTGITSFELPSWESILGERERMLSLLADLKSNGVAIIPDILPAHQVPEIKKRLVSHLHAIMDLPVRVNLLNPEHCSTLVEKSVLREQLAIMNAHLRRVPTDTRTTIIPRSSGNTGMGARSATALSIAQSLLPLFNCIFSSLYGTFCSVEGVDINLQPLY